MSYARHHFDGADQGTEVEQQNELETGLVGWHDRISIAGKLNAIVFACLLVLVVLAGGILGTMSYFSDAGEDLRILSVADANSSNASTHLFRASENLAAFAESGDASNIPSAQQFVQRAETKLAFIIEQDDSRLDSALIAEIVSAHTSVSDVARDASQSALTQEGARSLSERIDTINNRLLTATDGLNTRSTEAAEPVFDAIASSLIIWLAAFAILTALTFIASRQIAGGISSKIGEITEIMQDISKGNIEKSIPGRHRQDEIGAMARALVVFRTSSLELRNLNSQRASDAEAQLARQQSVSQQMHDLRVQKSQMLEGLADGFEVSVGELITSVSAASEQLKATSSQMVNLADDSNDQAESATEAMEKATANVTAAAAATDEFALSISEISRQASSSAALARDASDLVINANTRMTDLSVAAVEVGEIVDLIQTIAQRTNLLALNASIEAARGGEAGRGFAVVASEVKELAMQTSNATSNITGKITAMQDSTKSSAGDLTSIVERISELEQVAVTIASAVDQQSVSGEELARNIDTVAAGSAQVGERLNALRTASEETGSAADDVVSSANSLGAHAEDLRAKASRFIADVRRSARELDTGDNEFE